MVVQLRMHREGKDGRLGLGEGGECSFQVRVT